MQFHLALGLLAGLIPLAISVPLVPSQDPFYTAPANISSAQPGEILRTRTIISAIVGLLPDPVQSWQVLYRTSDLHGNAIASVTTIFKPSNASLDRFVTFMTAEDSADPDTPPSYNYQLLSVSNDAIVSAEFLLIQQYLSQGWIISSPDYEGPEAAWTAGRLEAMVALDSMRAVNNFYATLGLLPNSANVIAGTGYSGGAIASAWSAQLQADYAPELQLKGWFAGGTPANLTALVPFIAYTTWSGFLPISVAGLSKPTAYGATLAPLLTSVATAYGTAAIQYADTHGVIDVLLQYNNQSILDYKFQTLGPALLENPIVAKVLGETLMGQSEAETPKVPVLLLHALNDEIVPYGPALTLYENWCAMGATVNFTTLAHGGHVVGELNAASYAIDFIHGVFNGSITADGSCSQSTALVNSSVPNLRVRSDSTTAQFNTAAAVLALADAGNPAALKLPIII